MTISLVWIPFVLTGKPICPPGILSNTCWPCWQQPYSPVFHCQTPQVFHYHHCQAHQSSTQSPLANSHQSSSQDTTAQAPLVFQSRLAHSSLPLSPLASHRSSAITTGKFHQSSRRPANLSPLPNITGKLQSSSHPCQTPVSLPDIPGILHRFQTKSFVTCKLQSSVNLGNHPENYFFNQSSKNTAKQSSKTWNITLHFNPHTWLHKLNHRQHVTADTSQQARLQS